MEKMKTSEEAKRANHNALERKRRIYQKERLQELRVCVPIIRTEKPSTVEILQKSTEYIDVLRGKHSKQQSEIDELRRVNKDLTEKLNQCSDGKVEVPVEFRERASLSDLSLSSNILINQPVKREKNSNTATENIAASMNPVHTNRFAGESVMSRSMPNPDPYLHRKRSTREDEIIRHRKISKSEDMELAAEVGLLQNFCTTVRKSHSPLLSTSMAVDQPDNESYMFDIEMGEANNDGNNNNSNNTNNNNNSENGFSFNGNGDNMTFSGHGFQPNFSGTNVKNGDQSQQQFLTTNVSNNNNYNGNSGKKQNRFSMTTTNNNKNGNGKNTMDDSSSHPAHLTANASFSNNHQLKQEEYNESTSNVQNNSNNNNDNNMAGNVSKSLPNHNNDHLNKIGFNPSYQQRQLANNNNNNNNTTSNNYNNDNDNDPSDEENNSNFSHLQITTKQQSFNRNNSNNNNNNNDEDIVNDNFERRGSPEIDIDVVEPDDDTFYDKSNQNAKMRRNEQQDQANNSCCYCNGPWNGRFMIMCDSCDRWVHGICTGIDQHNVPDTFYCRSCNN